jgi:hypothetical protein
MTGMTRLYLKGTGVSMAVSKPDQLVSIIEAKFGSLDAFSLVLDFIIPLLDRDKVAAKISVLEDAQDTSQKTFEDQINAQMTLLYQTTDPVKKAEIQQAVWQIRANQAADFQSKRAPIEVKKNDLAVLEAKIRALS